MLAQREGRSALLPGWAGKVVDIHSPVNGDGTAHSDVSSQQRGPQHMVVPLSPLRMGWLRGLHFLSVWGCLYLKDGLALSLSVACISHSSLAMLLDFHT